MTRHCPSLAILALPTILSLPLLSCTTNPATGKSQFNYYSTSEEIQIGEQAGPELTKEYGGTVPDVELQAYVARVGRTLASKTEGDNPNLPWEFTLLNDEIVNAFALPGGKVFISRGLMEKMTNEAQLAGVLGHECGHVTAQHIDQQMGQTLAVGIGLSVLGAATSDSDRGQAISAAAGLFGQGYLLKYGRDQESEADTLGMRYMARSGYDPAGQLQVMQILKAVEKEAGGRGAPEWLSTHPAPQTRIDRIRRLLSTTFADTQGKPDQYGLFEDRFAQTALPRLKALPPVPKSGAAAGSGNANSLDDTPQQPRRQRRQRPAGGSRGSLPASDNLIPALLGNEASHLLIPSPDDILAHPESWCAHCRVSPVAKH